MLRYLFSLLLFTFTFSASSQEADQDSISDLRFGLNLGAYWAEKGAARFYNGSSSKNSVSNGENSIQRVFNTDLYYQELKNKEFNDYNFELQEIAQDMTYETAFLAGLHGSYYLDPTTAVVLDLSFISLEATGQFTILVQSPQQVGEDIRTADISGREQRFTSNIGLHKKLGEGKIVPFIEAGGVITSLQPKSNKIRIGSSTYNIFQNAAPHQDPDPPGGFGYGGYGQVGIELGLNNDFALHLGYWGTYERDPLTTSFAFQQALLFRIIYR